MHLTEQNMDATEYYHPELRMRVLKVIPLDPDFNESTFDIAFNTPAVDSTGVTHIIEHSVLCGSEHFHLKEPFQVLLQSSLQTYLNAGTYNEHTVYPFSTRSEDDYFNIMRVYLDAVFNPLIHSQDEIFRQEGHRLQLENGTLTR